MAIFGLITQKQYNKLQQEFDAFKANFLPYEPWQLETARAERYTLADPSKYEAQAELFRKISWIVQAVDITSSAAALTPFSVARLVAGKEPKDIPNHPFELLLNHPNPHDSRYEFLYAAIAFYMLNGNAYWWLNREDENQPPDEMWFIPPHMIIPVPDEHLYLKGYLYYPGNGMEIFLDVPQIVHFKRFNPFSRFVGLSAIESIAVTAFSDREMMLWQSRYYGENNARLPGILSFEQMIADPTWEKIKADTREAARNRELLMLRGVGQGGPKWVQNSISQKDMDFIAIRNFNKNEIYDTLAPGLTSMLSESSTEANSRTGRAVFNELTVYPKHVLMSEKITNSILPAYLGRPLIGHFEDIRITDKQMEIAEQEKYILTHTVDEIREEYYGDEPIGDERGKLFPAQINAQSGGIQKPPPNPFLKPDDDKKDKLEELEKAENKPPEIPDEKEQAAKAEISLKTWRSVAIKKVGKVVEYNTADVPNRISEYVNERLSHCKSAKNVRDVFDEAIRMNKSKSNQQDVASLLEGIRLAISG